MTKYEKPYRKKGFMSIIESYPHDGVERFELTTPCSQIRGQLINFPSTNKSDYIFVSFKSVSH